MWSIATVELMQSIYIVALIALTQGKGQTGKHQAKGKRQKRQKECPFWLFLKAALGERPGDSCNTLMVLLSLLAASLVRNNQPYL